MKDDAVRRFVAMVPSAIAEDPLPDVAERHIEAILAAARPQRSVFRVWRRRVAATLGLTTTKIAIGLAVAFAATGVLAASGVLPAPAQRALSSTIGHVGVHLDSRTRGSSGRHAASSAHAGRIASHTGAHPKIAPHRRRKASAPSIGTPSRTTVWRAIACRCATLEEARSTVDELSNDIVFSQWQWQITEIDPEGSAVYYEVAHPFTGAHAIDDSSALARRLEQAGFVEAGHEESPPSS
jgi:hypothetical protein